MCVCRSRYIDEYSAFAAKSGNGGFFHSCHLGAYWPMEYRTAACLLWLRFAFVGFSDAGDTLCES